MPVDAITTLASTVPSQDDCSPRSRSGRRLPDASDVEIAVHLNGRTAIVVGASRGLGRGIAMAFANAGASVVAVSRTAAAFPATARGAGTIQLEVDDAGDATVASSLLDRYEPEIVLVARRPPYSSAAAPDLGETFTLNRQADVHVPLDARDAAQAAAARQQSGRV